MTENDRKILARACGLCWHEYGCNPTFTTPDDWELVRVKVVKDYRGSFTEFIVGDIIRDDGIMAIRWWLSWELCQFAADFIKTRPDLFPWIVEFAAEIAKETIKSEPNPTQIASGKRMPWEENNG